MAGTVYSLGSILVDLTVELPWLPHRGGDVLATRTRTAAGGGINLASAVARQGIRCVYAGPHGTGPYGELVRAALAAEGVEVATSPRAEGDTGFSITLVEPDGERTFVTMPGVESELRTDDLAGLVPNADDLVALSGYDLVYPVSGEVLTAWLSSGRPDISGIALDPGPLVADIPSGRLRAVLSRVAVLTMNQREARLLSGASGASHGDLLAAVRRVPGVPTGALVVVREGAHGCVASGGSLGDGLLAVPAPAVTVVDTTGAGDTHTGVLLAALASGRDVESALTLATTAAAVSVTTAGPATAPIVMPS